VGFFFGLPSVAGEPGLLKEAGVTPTRGRQSDSQLRPGKVVYST